MRPGGRPPWQEPQEDEAQTISDCFMVSFDIGENLDVPTAVVGKQASNGFHVVNIFTEDDAITLYENLTGEHLTPY